jgi:twitching motility two-component system response regulator PilG
MRNPGPRRDAAGMASRSAQWRTFQSESVDESPPLADIKIMVIDDSATIRASAALFLSQAGAQVVLAEDGFVALAKLHDEQPAVVFCDILMPRLDGYQTCALIKRNPRFAATPVIMLSSKDGLFDRARGQLADCDGYLTKPFSPAMLVDTARRLGGQATMEPSP